ncbi:DUF2809 domain-containing protein [Bradyrhizobium sp. STM 3809]|uniref:ribosomal maturation YjgA family protein n=1 Tax=Bradyrhizobium sp. STM 3809 TaxID=551936 RepID=UPI0002408E94|nr:DUF2809 domain-containing protein [Bradyrhizobium sp. STM 3809]CCE01259.1 conserved membrane hypothetical protein [Bradyrhizobium sp. STM 3809]
MTRSSPEVPPRARERRRRAIALAAALIVIALGLALRFVGPGLGLPAGIVKYGGSILWATMVYMLLVALRPRSSRRQVGGLALAVAVLVEASRLIHTPWLDSFRLTLAGALLLGRIFSLWNIAAYAVGILMGIAIDRIALRSSSR